MSTEDTHQDVTYTIPAHGEHKAFHEAATAFRGVDLIGLKQPPAVIKQFQQIKEEKVDLITIGDVDRAVDEVVKQYAAANIAPADIDKLKASYMSNVGTPKSNLGDMKLRIMAELGGLARDTTGIGGAATSQQQQLEQIWNHIKALEKDINDAIEHGIDKGYLDPKDKDVLRHRKERKELADEQAKIDAMPDGPEKEAAKKELLTKSALYAEHDKPLIEREYHEARKRGDKEEEKYFFEQLPKADQIRQQVENYHDVKSSQKDNDQAIHDQINEDKKTDNTTSVQPNPNQNKNSEVSSKVIDLGSQDALANLTLDDIEPPKTGQKQTSAISKH